MRPAILFSAFILAAGVAGATPPRAEAQTRAGDPAAVRAAAGRIAAALARLATGEGDWAPFALTYDDLHGLHGGLTLTIRGDGTVEQKAVRQKAGEARTVSRRRSGKWRRLLERHRAWEQREAERTARPDESRGAAGRSHTAASGYAIWEWHNEYSRRTDGSSRVRDAMRREAWKWGTKP